MRLDPAIIRQQIDNLILQHPELAEDDVLRTDMIEGETDAFEFLSALVARIHDTAALAGGTATVIADLDNRLRRFERRQQALRDLAFKVMSAADIKKAELPAATLSIRNGAPKVIITDEGSLPANCLRTKVEPDKTRIKDLLSAGTDIPGAALSNAEPSLSIRVK
jgi:hypothetical protein